mmetsp:Transcript_17311/g.30511  ORF Transcript_17311/g.30511 Transcript_17311/m.30511 type:complete len:586 (+) Transcript_17311:94-1851(+)
MSSSVATRMARDISSKRNNATGLLAVMDWLKGVMAVCGAILMVRALFGPQYVEPEIPDIPHTKLSHSVTTFKGIRGSLEDIPSNRPVDFNIIVLGYKRWQSMQRLLVSLDEAEYYGDNIHLHLHIDGGSGLDWEKSVNLAEKANWKFGPKTVQVSPVNRGLAAAWLSAWKPSSDLDRAVILEDDVEVSPLFYRWLKLMYDAYDDRPEIAAYTLQRQALIATTGSKKTIMSTDKPFGYKLLGSWGFAPSAKHWRKFIELDFKKLNPNVKGLITSKWFQRQKRGKMWTQFFIWYCEQHNLYNIYITPPDKKTLATNFRERGVHFSKRLGPDFARLSGNEWNDEWNNPPLALDLYSWGLKIEGQSLPPGYVGNYVPLPESSVDTSEDLSRNESREAEFSDSPVDEAYPDPEDKAYPDPEDSGHIIPDIAEGDVPSVSSEVGLSQDSVPEDGSSAVSGASEKLKSESDLESESKSRPELETESEELNSEPESSLSESHGLKENLSMDSETEEGLVASDHNTEKSSAITSDSTSVSKAEPAGDKLQSVDSTEENPGMDRTRDEVAQPNGIDADGNGKVVGLGLDNGASGI